jgi:excisionase family DNA binding protein
VGDPPPPIGDAFTVRQAAARLGCSQQTIRRWLDEGRLPKHVTFPTRRVRIPREAVERASRLHLPEPD